MVANHISFAANQIRMVANRISLTANQIRKVANRISLAANQIRKVANHISFAANRIRKVANRISFAANQVRKVANRVSFAANRIRKVANHISFAANQHIIIIFAIELTFFNIKLYLEEVFIVILPSLTTKIIIMSTPVVESVHVVLDTKNLKGLRIGTYGSHIYSCLNGNANFSGILPALVTLQNLITTLNNAAAVQIKGDKTTTKAVQVAEYNLKRLLKFYAAYVEYYCNDNAVVALTSGFSLRQHASLTTLVFSAVHGVQIGEVDLKSKGSKGASYIFQYTTTPLVASSWITSSTQKQVKHTVTGLTVGTMYYFRVAVVTKAGQQPFCTPVNLMVV